MKTKTNKDFSKGMLIKAELISRPNSTNGKYRACQLDQLAVDNLVKIKDSDIFFLETLQMKADLADKMIAETEAQGNTNDSNIMKVLGKKVNAAGTPIHRKESIMTSVVVSFQLIVYYGIAIGIWSLVFGENFFMFSFYGSIAGLLISLLFVVPISPVKRTKERIREIVSGVGLSLGNFGIIIGLMGLVAWVIRLIFIK